MITYGKHEITKEDIDSVVKVLQSDYITQGSAVPLFEKDVANYCKTNYAVSCNSATSALHIACLSLGLGQGDWLWTTPITFVASANCGLYCGARVDFVDIDPETYNLSPVALEEKLRVAEKNGCLPKIVIPVHFCGQSCDMKEIYRLSQIYNFSIIEDASHAIGGKYYDLQIGNCRYSDITVFSFHPVKIITTGEGGVALTNNTSLAHNMKLLRSHGITRDHKLMIGEPDGWWFYQQIDLGFNYRMTDIQAALGSSQMNRLDQYVSFRNDIAARYNNEFASLPIKTQYINPECYSSFHLYVIQIHQNDRQLDRKRIFESLYNSGIGVNVHYIPVYSHPYYKEIGFNKDDFPVAEAYYRDSITIPMHSGLSEGQQEFIVDCIRNLLQS